MARGERWLSKVRKRSLATLRGLTYVFGDTGTQYDLTGKGVVLGSSQTVLDTNQVVYLSVEDREYLIPVELLSRTPQQGDEMIETFADGSTARFRAQVSGGIVESMPHDRERSAWRVRMDQIKVKT